jgi:hypothetical protein
MSDAKGTKGLFFSLIFIVIILSAIIALRELRGMQTYTNGESYYNLRVSQELTKDPLYDTDPLQGTPYFPSAYHYFLALSILAFGLERTTHFAPIILGAVFSIVFYRMLVNLNFPRSNAVFSTMLLAVTPAFISVFSGLYLAGFTVLLSMLSLLLYFEKNYWEYPWKPSGKICFLLCILSLSLLAITSLLGFALTVIILFGLSILQNKGVKSFLLAAVPPCLILLSLSVFTNYLPSELARLGFEYFDLTRAFSLFGAGMGLDIFLFLLFFTGLIIMWGHISSLRAYHLLSLVLVAISFFNPLLRMYSSILITVYCVFAIKYLYYTKWELEIVKTGTIILFVCALVFSSVSQVNTLINAEPGAGASKLLEVLKEEPKGIVLTEPGYGFSVQYLSDQRTMLDDNMYSYTSYYDILGDYNYILGLVRLKGAEPMLQKYGIKYILITPGMKENVWLGKEEEFLLLLRNSDKFQELYATPDGFELWLYKGQAS